MGCDYNFTLIRHGEVLANREGRFTGILDQELTEKGIRQAQDTSVFLQKKNVHIKTIYSSPLKRCKQTAEIIADALKLPFEINPYLRERNYGVFEGLKFSEVEQQYPNEYAQYQRDKPFYTMPRGENAYDLEKRVKEFIDHIKNTCNMDCEILVVTHLNPIRAFLRLLGLADWDVYYKKFQNASVTRLFTNFTTSELIWFDQTIYNSDSV